MNTNEILESIDAELSRLEQVKALPAGSRTGSTTSVATPNRRATSQNKKGPKKRTMSAEGRARVAAAQRARWAKAKKG
jgi:hypothetical protein